MQTPFAAVQIPAASDRAQQRPDLPMLLALSVQWDDCSVALGTRERVTSEVWSGQPERDGGKTGVHAGAFASRDALALLDRLLLRTDTALSTVDQLCFARGPGAFTSLRVAAGLIQGLSLATSIPVAGICSLAAMAAQDPGWSSTGPEEAPWLQLSAVDARMGECYFGLHECRAGHHPEPITAPAVGPPAEAVAVFELTLEQRRSHRGKIRIVPAGNGFSLLPELGAWAERHGFEPREAARYSATAEAVLAVAASIGAPAAGPARTALPVYIRDKIALDVDEQRAGAAARALAGAGKSPA